MELHDDREQVAYSVLMSVYVNERKEYLEQAIYSIMTQTIPPNDFVIVCDGPLTSELDAVITGLSNQNPDVFQILRLEKNQGLGKALNAGIKLCRNELVARMDSDDISRPYRCEKELEIFAQCPEVSIVGSAVEEFSVSPDHVEAMRIVPENNEDIIRFAKMRCPFNHPSVMFKKSDVINVGNYATTRCAQDYYLWVKMLMAGYQGYNVQEPLVWMRVTDNLFKRRSGRLYMEIHNNLFKYMMDNHFITYIQYLKAIVIHRCSSAAPNWLRKLAFRKMLRKT